MNELFSPMHFSPAFLSSISFKVADCGDSIILESEDFELKFRLNVKPLVKFHESDDLLECFCKLTFNAVVFLEDKDLEICKMECEIGTIADCAISEMDDITLNGRVLAANAISYVWGKARSHFEQISSASTIGPINLPAIDPYAVLSQLDDDETEE